MADSLRPVRVRWPRSAGRDLRGQRVLITGGSRGIGAGLARRLHERGARVALIGLTPERLSRLGAAIDAPWRAADVADLAAVTTAVDELVAELGGLDVVVANAGIARQLPMLGGAAGVLEEHLRVNTLGVFYTLQAAGPHVAHPGGYVLVNASLVAAAQVPLLGAYAASKAAAEALATTLRLELAPPGARVGVAYLAEFDTDMRRRGFDTRAARRLTGGKTVTPVEPVSMAVDAIERGIARRARRVAAPRWVQLIIPARDVAQRVIEHVTPWRLPRLTEALEMARHEDVDFTTPQPTHGDDHAVVHG